MTCAARLPYGVTVPVRVAPANPTAGAAPVTAPTPMGESGTFVTRISATSVNSSPLVPGALL
jgi:hypothetical protein